VLNCITETVQATEGRRLANTGIGYGSLLSNLYLPTICIPLPVSFTPIGL